MLDRWLSSQCSNCYDSPNQLFSLPTYIACKPSQFHFPVRTQLCFIETTVQSTADSASADKQGSKIKVFTVYVQISKWYERHYTLSTFRWHLSQHKAAAESFQELCYTSLRACSHLVLHLIWSQVDSEESRHFKPDINMRLERLLLIGSHCSRSLCK